jgi:predicted transcriptional regulator
MRQQDILLSINPYHLQLIRPLIKWKIMSIKEVFEDSGYPASYKTFHKIIQRLEKNGVIRSFKDVWTKTRRIYLTFEGNSLVAPYGHVGHVYNEQNIFHDSRVSLYMRFLNLFYPISSINLEHEDLEFKKKNSFQRVRPDARFEMEFNGKRSSFILEVELTQKSKERAIEKLANYKDDKSLRYVIFVFPTPSLYKSYLNLLKANAETLGKNNYIFVMDEGLVKGIPSMDAPAFYQNQDTTLHNVMKQIIGRIEGESNSSLDRLWRKHAELFF